MARRKKGDPIHGWLILDKPTGMTSNRALGIAKRLLNAQKAGHAGTLDPLATGVLPIAFGEATKTVSYAVDGSKSYRFAVRWGAETTTDDLEGDVVKTTGKTPTPAEIEAVLPSFVGEIEQVPPKFSAIKVNGERAYDLARDGEDVQLKARTVSIQSLEIADCTGADQTVFETDCGKGTYVRALARDMGRALGCLGHIVELRRTRVADFTEDSAIGLADFEDTVSDQQAEEKAGVLQPVSIALADLPDFKVTPNDAASLARGQSVIMRGRDAPIASGEGYATCGGKVVALVEADRGSLKPFRVFNL